jgi:hypothetical protein
MSQNIIPINEAPKSDANVPTILIPPSVPGFTILKEGNDQVLPFTLQSD